MNNSLSSLTRGLLTAAAFGIATLASLGSAHAQVAYSVDTVTNNLYTIDLTTGVATLIGPVGLGGDVEGLSFQPGTNILFGLEDNNDQLITINTETGAGTVVGPLGFDFGDAGLEFAANGVLYGSTDLGDDGLYQIDPLTGTATFIGVEADAHALGFFGGVLYGIRDTDDSLAIIDVTDGSVTVIGEIGFDTDEEGFVIDAAGTGFLVDPDNNSSIYTVNLLTGAATFRTAVSCTTCRFESLAIADLFQGGPGPVAAPIPAVPVFGIALLAALMLLAGVRHRNRQRN